MQASLSLCIAYPLQVVGDVQVGAQGEQCLHQLTVVALSRRQQRRPTVVVLHNIDNRQTMLELESFSPCQRFGHYTMPPKLS
jgi:hypothetical protein